MPAPSSRSGCNAGGPTRPLAAATRLEMRPVLVSPFSNSFRYLSAGSPCMSRGADSCLDDSTLTLPLLFPCLYKNGIHTGTSCIIKKFGRSRELAFWIFPGFGRRTNRSIEVRDESLYHDTLGKLSSATRAWHWMGHWASAISAAAAGTDTGVWDGVGRGAKPC